MASRTPTTSGSSEPHHDSPEKSTKFQETTSKEQSQNASDVKMDERSFVQLTGLMTAYQRAAESARPDRLINDPFAEKLSGDVKTQLESLTSNWKPSSERAVDMLAIRTRYLDEALANRNQDISQVVILASGMDTRAYRLEALKGCHVLEIDQSQECMDRKKRTLQQMAAEPIAQRVDYIVADLANDAWQVQLIENGFSPKKPTFWCLEGLLYYLDRRSIIKVIETMDALSSTGSQFWADMCGKSTLTSERFSDVQGLKYGEDNPKEGILSLIRWNLDLVARLDEPRDHFGRAWEPLKLSENSDEVVQWFFLTGKKPAFPGFPVNHVGSYTASTMACPFSLFANTNTNMQLAAREDAELHALGGGGARLAACRTAVWRAKCTHEDSENVDLATTHAFIAEWHGDSDDDDEQLQGSDKKRSTATSGWSESDRTDAERMAATRAIQSALRPADETMSRATVAVDCYQGDVSDVSPVKKAVKVHTRTRRAQEIRQLTAEREELETRLQMVREMVKAWPLRSMGLCDSSCDPCVSTSPTAMVMTATSRQQRRAERECEALMISEKKNQRLRAELKVQKQAARSLYRLMLRRAAEMAALRKSLQLPLLSCALPRDALDDRAVFARLLTDTRAMFKDVGRVATLLRSRIKLSEEGSFRKWSVNERAVTRGTAAPSPKRQLQLVDCEELPFPRSQVHHAIRAFYKEIEIRDFTKEHFTSIAGDEDTMLMKLVFPYDTYDTGSIHVRMRQVVRSFDTPEYSGFVSLLEANILTLNGQPSPMAPTSIEQKWTILPRTSKARDDNDASSLCEFETTQNQTFAIISQEVPNHFQTPPPLLKLTAKHKSGDNSLPADAEEWDSGYSSMNRRIQNHLMSLQSAPIS